MQCTLYIIIQLSPNNQGMEEGQREHQMGSRGLDIPWEEVVTRRMLELEGSLECN